MSLLDAVIRCGRIPSSTAKQSDKKRYSELLSNYLAIEVSEGLRKIGFTGTKPGRDGKAEKLFQGGLGTKKVDVSFSDDQHGLMLAVSIKSISSAPFGKNLKNRFADLYGEASSLHLRFPYAVVGALFAFPVAADMDAGQRRAISTFNRATDLMSSISGRREHTDPGERFEDATMFLFQPLTADRTAKASINLIDAQNSTKISEDAYFGKLLEMFRKRNPRSTLKEKS